MRSSLILFHIFFTTKNNVTSFGDLSIFVMTKIKCVFRETWFFQETWFLSCHVRISNQFIRDRKNLKVKNPYLFE